MLWGQAWTCSWETAEDILLIYDVLDLGDGTGAKVTLQAYTGYGNTYFTLVCDGRAVQTVFVPEGVARTWYVYYDPTLTVEHAVSAVPMGTWDDYPPIDPTEQQFDYTQDKAKTIEVDWDCLIEDLATVGDSGQLTAWTLTGLQRYVNCYTTPTGKTQAQIDVTLTNVAGTYTVNLWLGGSSGLLIATGSRVGNGVITLTAQNNSGLSPLGTDSVTVAYTADITTGCYVRARWAAKYELHIAQTLNFPRTPEATIVDLGLANRLGFKLQLASGITYNYLIRAITDTKVTGSNTASQGTKTIPGRPAPPGVPAYVSGNWTNTAINWTAASGSIDGYNVYDSTLGSPSNLTQTPTFVATNSITLASLAAAAAGIRRVTVASVKNGVEDGYRRSVALEYSAAGAFIPPRPNIPTFFSKTKNGRVLSVSFSYNPAGQAGIGVTAQLFIVAAGGTPNYASPDATLPLTSSVGKVIQTGTLTPGVGAGSDGHYQFIVRVATASGTQSVNTALGGPEWLSSAVPAAPANVVATLVG